MEGRISNSKYDHNSKMVPVTSGGLEAKTKQQSSLKL